MFIAHRGARAFAPENTLQAFAKAAELGARMVEFDVQLTADGEVIVVHDDTLERCSNIGELFPSRRNHVVQSFTLAEIRQLDAGTWFVRQLELEPNRRQPFLQSLDAAEMNQFIATQDRAEFASGLVRHPTLGESLALCRDLGLEANVELKAPESWLTQALERAGPGPVDIGTVGVSDKLVASVLDQIERFAMRDRVLLSSFDHSSLQRVAAADSRVRLGVLVTRPIANCVAYCRALNACAYHPGCLPGSDAVGFDSESYARLQQLPAEPFRSLRAAGIAVNVWTENDPVRMQHLLQAGASGIFTDYLNRAISVY